MQGGPGGEDWRRLGVFKGCFVAFIQCYCSTFCSKSLPLWRYCSVMNPWYLICVSANGHLDLSYFLFATQQDERFSSSSSSSSSLMRYPRAPLWWGGGEGGGEVLVKKGRRKVGEGERSSRVGLLSGLCLGLMACSMRPFPSFSMCFCGAEMET
ncbi:hypothetical protein INR49_010504 [Caranx melampygus]|nr:hypothetical protein INR49_010504 [Caranx melampygus]